VIFVLGIHSFLDFNSPPCITLATTSEFLSVETISKISLPSSNKIRSPAFTSFGKFFIFHETFSAVQVSSAVEVLLSRHH
jgi:hypothetical protein